MVPRTQRCWTEGCKRYANRVSALPDRSSHSLKSLNNQA